MGKEFGPALPLVIAPINVRDGNDGEFFVSDVLNAAQVDAIHLSDRRLGTDAKGSNSAVPTEVVLILSGVEPVRR